MMRPGRPIGPRPRLPSIALWISGEGKAILPLPSTTRKPTQIATTMSNALDVTDSTWESAVLQSQVPVLVDFWAEWCAPCRAMGPSVDKLATEFSGKLKVVKLNTQDNTEVPARYGINAIPTFLVIKNGEVAKQLIGQLPYEKLKAAVSPHL
jgi:thioredoxin